MPKSRQFFIVGTRHRGEAAVSLLDRTSLATDESGPRRIAAMLWFTPNSHVPVAMLPTPDPAKDKEAA